MEINIGDPVRFLYAQHLEGGKCVRVNKKSITVEYDRQTRTVPFNRVVHEADKFTVVWEMNVGVEGRYYITTNEFPAENATYQKWHQPFTYISK